MLKHRENLFRVIYGLFDVMLVGVSFVCALLVRSHLRIEPFPELIVDLKGYMWLLILILLLWWELLIINKVNNISYRGRAIRKVFFGIVKTNVQGLLIIGFILFFQRDELTSRTFLLIFTALCTLLLMAEKIVIFEILRKIRRLDRNLKYALIVGTGVKARKLTTLIQTNEDAGFRLIGILGNNRHLIGKSINGVPVIDESFNLSDILQKRVVDEVFFALSMDHIEDIERMVGECELLGVNSRIMTKIIQTKIASVYVDKVFGTSFITFSTRDTMVLQQYAKMFIDYISALILLVLTFPVFIIIAIAIKLDSKGPIFFKQVRAGMSGRKFTIYKFRTMVQNAESMRFELEKQNEMSGPVFKITNDMRHTTVGKFLRRTSLDELPQLFNVLIGDMSLVGPRPLFIYESNQISGRFRRRLSVRPGITGLWQVSGRSDLNFEKWMVLDLEYIDNWSIWLDLKILCKTLFVPLTKKGAY
jgi:exopolysaccharide biosynthesis polyprenyl glycosylphosphotransferase